MSEKFPKPKQPAYPSCHDSEIAGDKRLLTRPGYFDAEER